MNILKKIRSLTTNIGIYQHSKLDKPDPAFGYALEDQARALILVNNLNDEKLKKIYLDFIIKAKRKDDLLYHFCYENNGNCIFRNEENNSVPNLKEAYGIALWALLTIYNNKFTKYQTKIKIKGIIENLIKDAYEWTSPRAISAALLGLLNMDYPDNLENKLIKKLFELFNKTSSEEWVWFENYLVYANAIIPWALWETYIKRGSKISFKIAKKTTEFLINICQENNIPAPVGNKGWYYKGKEKALYDQQPVDAGYMVCCLEKAYNATDDKRYLNLAKEWYNWFWGNNINKIPLIDNELACYDSLTPEGVNLNQGAESNICFLMAHLAAKRLQITK